MELFHIVLQPKKLSYDGKYKHNDFRYYTAKNRKTVLRHLVETGEVERIIEVQDLGRVTTLEKESTNA